MTGLCGIIPSKHLMELGFGGSGPNDINAAGGLNSNWFIHAQAATSPDVLEDVKSDFGPSSVLRSDEFRMYGYKILPCPKAYRHDWAVCPFAHNGERARRRDPRVFNYVDILCPNTRKKKACPRADSCPFAHNIYEYWLHPNRYRTELCRDGHTCNRDLCFFAHCDNELRRALANTAHGANSVLGLDSATAALLEGEDGCDLDGTDFGAAALAFANRVGAVDSRQHGHRDHSPHLQLNHSSQPSQETPPSSTTPQKIVDELKNMVSMVESNAGQFSPAILDWLENAVARLRSHQRLVSQSANQDAPIPGSPGLPASEPEPRALRTSSNSSRGSHEAAASHDAGLATAAAAGSMQGNPAGAGKPASRSPTLPLGSPLLENSANRLDTNMMWVLGHPVDVGGSPALQAVSEAPSPRQTPHSPLEAGLGHLQEPSLLWPNSPQLSSQRSAQEQAGVVHRSSSAPAAAMDPLVAQLLATLSLVRPSGPSSSASSAAYSNAGNGSYGAVDNRTAHGGHDMPQRALLRSQLDMSPVLGVPSGMSQYPTSSPLPLLSSLSSQGASPQLPFSWDGGAAGQLSSVSTSAQFNEMYNRLVNSGYLSGPAAQAGTPR